MITIAYSIFDTKAGLFNTPFFMQNDAMAIRAVTDLVNDPNTSVHRHPADYILMKLGYFSDENGNLSAQVPENLAVLVSLVKPDTQGALFNG